MKRLFVALNDVTGVRVDRQSLRFAAEDAHALWRVMRDRGARRDEAAAVESAGTPDDWFDVSRTHFGVGPVQSRVEIFGMLELAAQNQTRVACEIGAQDAGSSLLFSRVLPQLDTLIVMDLFVKNRWRLRRAAPDQQAVHTIDGDSTKARTVERLARKLAGRKLDLLLIDGDHRYDGVRLDFLTYRRFVRDGGLIAFHDIMPVRNLNDGRWVGDVPAFWSELKPLYETREFITAPDQQGLGIGVVLYDSSVPTPSL